ncbi:MAG: tRNA (adenosine(37)-N6)-dimethylallyltransferase MiaA, partial [Acidimicrobiia bacterium]
VRCRIAERFAAMRTAGLVEEVRRLASDPRGWSRTARQAIGYKEILAHLEGDEPSLDAALDAAVRRTRAFSRRQRVWFRRDPRITWFGAPENSCTVLPALLAWWCP